MRVDVVIPCYNYGRYLEQCVRSVLDQEGVDVRALIIDDTSRDDSPDVGRRLAAADRRVEFRRHEVNRGHIATYNEGLLEWASGDLVLLLSADDLLAPGALRRAAHVFERDPAAVLVYGLTMAFWTEGIPESGLTASDEYRVLTGSQFLDHCCTGLSNPVPTAGAVVRTWAQQQVGGYDKALPHSGDFEMWMRLAVRGNVGIVRGPQAFSRQHTTNMSHAYNRPFWDDLDHRWGAIEAALRKDAAILPDAATRLAAVKRHIVEDALWRATAALEAGRPDSADAAISFARSVDRDATGSLLYYKTMLRRRLWRWPALTGMTRTQPPTPTAVPFKTVGWWPPGAGERFSAQLTA